VHENLKELRFLLFFSPREVALAETPSADFDFQSKLKEFDKEHEEGDDEAGDVPQPINTNVATSYEKDDFFDSISCDAIDRQAGIDNRLRGSTERSLNTETFGAVALNSQRRRRRFVRGGGGGTGGGGREGNRNDEGERTNSGGGRGAGGRGRGRGRGGRGRGRGRSGDGRGGASKENRQPS
jgi:protein LSM14